MADTSEEQLQRAKRQLLHDLGREVKDPRVLDAIWRVPREEFVPADLRPFAYENRPLPIGYDQTISQPLIVALMTEALLLNGTENVLEVGTGSGYQAALLSLLSDHVVSVEAIEPLATAAAERLRALAYVNVDVFTATAGLGWPSAAPYDAIMVTAAAPEVPASLLGQLAMGGRLLLPVGGRNVQELVRIIKKPEGARRHNLGPCRFVPLLGRDGWPEVRAS